MRRALGCGSPINGTPNSREAAETDVERIIIFVIFGVSMLMIPVWLVLEARKNARERAELERRIYLEEDDEGGEVFTDSEGESADNADKSGRDGQQS